jgi:hypothetical protein
MRSLPSSDEWHKERVQELQEVCAKHFPHATAYFFTPPPRTDTPDRKKHTEAVRKVIMSLEEKPKFCFIDLSLEFERAGGNSVLLASDGIHLKPDGVFVIAEKIDFLLNLLTKQRSFRERIADVGPGASQQLTQSGGHEVDFVGQSGLGGFPRARRPWRGRPRGGRLFRGRPSFHSGSPSTQPQFYGAPGFSGSEWSQALGFRGGHYGPPDFGRGGGAFQFASPNPNYSGGYSNFMQ